MNYDKLTFEEWHEELSVIAFRYSGTAFASTSWRSDYDQGKTPEQAWDDKWG